VPIAPDTKDWTWVLQRPCPQCGFEASQVRFAEIPSLVVANARAWTGVLAAASVRERPDSSTWSPLEYACHVRDVHRVFTERLTLMLEQDGPQFADWDQDGAAVAGRYGEQEPQRVLAELLEAAETSARAFGAVPPPSLDRPGARSNGSQFTVETLARYYVHDPVHHRWDVTGKP
jgi:hypothetical protein